MLLERKVPLRQRQVERQYSKNLVPDRLFFQTTPAFPPSFLTLMSKYGAWVTSKQENENFQLAKLKSVGSCEEIDVTAHCGRHLHLSTISSRRSGQAWKACFFIPTLLTTRQIGSPSVWFSPISSRSSQVSGWLDDCSMSVRQVSAGSRGVPMSSIALERLRKSIRNQFNALILFYN